MAFKAHLEPGSLSGIDTDARSNERRALWLETSGVLPGGLEANVAIHNLSAAGLLLETEMPLSVGEQLILDLPEAGSVPALVVWQSGHLFGCAFEQALEKPALAAAQLRAQAPVPATPALTSAPAEPLGLKLNRLRREKGLTLARVASALGVSKPTVWAWEKGKAKPVPQRLEAIAEVLGVESVELEGGLRGNQDQALIEECRSRIAVAYGMHPSKVRIMLEV